MREIYKLFIFLTLILFTASANGQVSILLYQEDFNTGTSSFVLNSGGPSSNTGNNIWIINDEYNGNSIYPNTPDQTKTMSGTINGAPFSKYLHIHDKTVAPGTANDNYNPSNASDNFAQMGTSFCTVGLQNITLTFFYICEGTASDYGELYYSINGGSSWVLKAGPYNNTSLWKYVSLTDPAWAGQPDVRFGWRWKNNGSGAPNSISFGVDDIFVVGDYDNTNPVTINITSVTSPVCQGSSLTIGYSLSRPLCDGTYQIDISGPTGTFSGNNLGIFNIGTGQTSGAISIPALPTSLGPGTCYKVRISRISPPPQITGVASICFTIQACPNTIRTLKPVVLNGPDTLCVNSVIDVPFYSTGVYKTGNNYIAQLSDANGVFPASPMIIGSSPDNSTYDPTVYPYQPGNVSGKIPATAVAGCNYYIRVISTNPGVIPPPANYYGPFCLKRCDVETNNTLDISLCITPTRGVDTTVTFKINSWTGASKYAPGQQFQIQLLDSKTYAIINTGVMGTVTLSTSGSLTLHVPPLPGLGAIPLKPGMYYMRIIATGSSVPGNALGTLIRLTIGTINPPVKIIPQDTVVCAGDLLDFTIIPYNPESTYEWYSPTVNGGKPFYWGYNPLTINFSPGSPPGDFWITVRENNYGCFSPYADTVHVQIISKPLVAITGPSPLCQGDTATFKVQFLAETYYSWTSTWGTVIDTSNNVIRMVFDSLGSVKLTIFGLNRCGSNTGSKTITVQPKPILTHSSDTIVCKGETVVLNAKGTVTSGTPTYTWYDSTASVGTGSTLTVTPDEPKKYVISVANTVGCKSTDTVSVNLFPVPDVNFSVEDISCYSYTDGTATALPASGTPPYQYLWSTTPNQTTASITGLDDGMYYVMITDANGCKDDTIAVVNEPMPMGISFVVTPVSYGHTDGSAAVGVQGGTAPYTYQWSTEPPQFGTSINNLKEGTYTVTVTDAEGCTQVATVIIKFKENGLYIPNAFSPNGDGKNDFLDVYTVNLKEARMAIFNRWGEKVFETTDLSQRWNGFYKGQQEAVGAYAYFIEATFLDGTTQFKKGNVTIIK